MAEIWYKLHHLQDPALQLNMVDDDATSMRSISSEDVSMGGGSCCFCPKGGDPKAKIRRQCQMLQVSLFIKFILILKIHVSELHVCRTRKILVNWGKYIIQNLIRLFRIVSIHIAISIELHFN